MEKENGLIAKWGYELFDDGITNAPQCFMRYGRRFVKSTHFQLICCIISYQYGSDAPYPSRETIANDMGISVKRVGTLLQEIEADENVEIYWRYVNGKRSSSEYNFKSLIDKCLEHSKQLRAEKNKDTKLIKKKKTLKEQSVPLVKEQSIPLAKEQCVPLGLEQSVPSKKEREERKIKQEVESVCTEEQEVLSLLESRTDIDKHTHTQLLALLQSVKKKENFNFSIFRDTLNKVDFDIQNINYFKRALTNNIKDGFVRPANKRSAKKEQISPAAEEKELTKEEWLTQAVKQRETKGDVDKMSQEEKEAYFKQAEELRKKLEGSNE